MIRRHFLPHCLQPSKKSLIRAAAFLLVAAGVMILFGPRWANQYARVEVLRQLNELNCGDVQVGKVSVGLDSIYVEDVCLYCEDDNRNIGCRTRWLAARKLEIDINLISAILGNTKINRIVVCRPTIDVQLDEQGNLATNLLKSQDQENQAIHLRVNHATVRLHQTGRESLVAQGVNLSLDKYDDSIKLSAAIDDLLDSKWQATFQQLRDFAKAKIEIANANLDSEQLSRFPLIPSGFFAGMKFKGRSHAAVEVFLSDQQVTDYRISLAPDFKTIFFDAYGDDIKDLKNGKINITPDKIQFRSVDAGLMCGTLTIDCDLKIHRGNEFKIAGPIDVVAKNTEVHEVTRLLLLPVDMRGPMNFAGRIHLEIDKEKFTINGTADGSATDFTIETLPADAVSAHLTLDQVTQYYDYRKPNLTGEIRVECISNDQDVGRVIAALGTRYDIPVPPVKGTGKTLVNVVVPLDETQNKEWFWADIKVAADELDVGGINFSGIKTDMTLFSDRYEIKDAIANYKSTTEQLNFSGVLKWPTEDSINFELQKSDIPSSLLSNYFDFDHLDFAGRLNLTGTLSAQRDAQKQIRALGTGLIKSNNLRIQNIAVDKFSSPLKLNGDILVFEDINADFEQGHTKGSAKVALTEKSIEARMRFKECSINQFARLVNHNTNDQTLAGRFDLDGQIRLSLAPFKIESSGSAVARKLDFNNFSVDQTNFQFVIDEQKIVLTDVVASKISESSSSLLADCKSSSICLNHSGFVDEAIDVTFKGLSVNCDSFAVENIDGNMIFDNSDVALNADGTMLGGKMSARLDTAVLTSTEAKNQIALNLTIKNGRLEKLLNKLKLPKNSVAANGRFDTKLCVSIPRNTGPMTVGGLITLKSIRLNRDHVIKTAQAKVSFDGSLLSFDEINARLANGLLRGRFSWPLNRSRHGLIALTGQHINAKQLAQLFPHLPIQVEGKSNFRLLGKIEGAGSAVRISGHGNGSVFGGKVNGIKWQVDHGSFDWNYSTKEKRGEINTRRCPVKAFGGQIQTDICVKFGRRFSLDCDALISAVDSARLSKDIPDGLINNNGKLNGVLKLSGRNIRSFDDLSGSFKGRISQAQVLRLPVLDSVGQFVNKSQLQNQRFADGVVDLRLQKGKIKIRQFSFSDSLAQVLVDGDVSLKGRLALSVIIHVGAKSNDPLRQIIKSPLLASTAPPVVLLARVEELLTDRMLFFKIHGTFRNPRVKIETAKILRQETLKFILDKTYNLSLPSNAWLNRTTIRLR